jgi:deoxyribonuclease V
MNMVNPISWPTIPTEAIRLQKELAAGVKTQPLPAWPRILAALDLAYLGPPRKPTRHVAGVVVYDLEGKKVIERQAVTGPVTFPYIPGLLSFREAPAALEVIEKIKTPVDVFLIDGQGLAHPRRFGVACHIGVLIGRPTLGCAKSRLVGDPEKELPQTRGAWVHLIDKNQVVGAVVRSRTGVKPLYVSVGHLITLPEAIKIVLAAGDHYRLPEPARLAHNYVTLIARERSGKGLP